MLRKKTRRFMAVRKRGTDRRRVYAISIENAYWDEKSVVAFATLTFLVLAGIGLLAYILGF